MRADHLLTINSYLRWWHDAGVVDAVADAPFNWLDAAAVADAPTRAASGTRSTADNPIPQADDRAAPVTGQPVAGALPTTLSAFDDWWMTEPSLPGAAWSANRIAATGPAAARLMLVFDVPDVADLDADQLCVGAPGRLLDAMLAAIALRRDEVRIAAIAATRPPGGQIDPASAQALRAIALHHIQLVEPAQLLLVGQQTSLILSGQAVASSSQQLKINHNDASLVAHAIHHPRLLIERPMLKRQAWSVLKMFREQA